ncbi:hypothetical protein AMELA_G00001930 [Ameiurus melas]|uniref:Ig-like domain-containing protein n=1 Tax=Ameiurus melas TaxID=219545 RepID=A0A7J6BGP3_AMEME|nr:hypothetical protein AMELA_G00001930 [Ameiurus melas]
MVLNGREVLYDVFTEAEVQNILPISSDLTGLNWNCAISLCCELICHLWIWTVRLDYLAVKRDREREKISIEAIMCTQIGIHLGTFMFVMMFLTVSPISNHHALVKVYDPVLLTCNNTCSGDVTWTLSVRTEIRVSECKRSTCVEGHGFENRTRLVHGGPSLQLNPVMYNDKGWYICYCDKDMICKFHLDVVFPTLKSVCVGKKVTIPCYTYTDKRILDENINVQWEKDGKPFVTLQHGKMSYGPSFEGRGFITLSQYKNEDLSLTIPKVQQSDGGIYRCRHRHEELGQPEAVNLRISESSECEAVKQSTFPWWGVLLVVVAIVVIFCVGVLYKYFTHIFSCWKRTQNDAVDEEISMLSKSNGKS